MLDLAKSAFSRIVTSLGGKRRQPEPFYATPLVGIIGTNDSEAIKSRYCLAYLRIVSGGWRELISKYLTAEEFSSRYFGLEDPEQSVFRAENPFEEAEAIAAHFLSLHGNAIVKEGVAIRIYPADIFDLPIQVSARGEIAGSTGINSVDARHHDLAANEDSLKKLSERILRDHYLGGDRIRVVGNHQMVCQLVRAVDGENNLSTKSKNLYDKVMKDYRKKTPNWDQCTQ
jgi:hypothetical protein